MIIFTNVRKSIDYKDFITQNVHPAENCIITENEERFSCG